MVTVPGVIQAGRTVWKAWPALNVIFFFILFVGVVFFRLLSIPYNLGEPFFTLKQTFSLMIKVVSFTVLFQTELARRFRCWGTSTTNWARKANMSMIIRISPIRALDSFYWWLRFIRVDKIYEIITCDVYRIIFVFLNSEFIHQELCLSSQQLLLCVIICRKLAQSNIF